MIKYAVVAVLMIIVTLWTHIIEPELPNHTKIADPSAQAYAYFESSPARAMKQVKPAVRACINEMAGVSVPRYFSDAAARTMTDIMKAARKAGVERSDDPFFGGNMTQSFARIDFRTNKIAQRVIREPRKMRRKVLQVYDHMWRDKNFLPACMFEKIGKRFG